MNNDLISREALKEDFKTRLEKAKRWKENAINRGDDEIVIRATATIDFICEVIMTIINAPAVEPFEKNGAIYNENCGAIRLEDGLKKARYGKYVVYDVDFLLDNLAREVNIMESTRHREGGAE